MGTAPTKIIILPRPNSFYMKKLLFLLPAFCVVMAVNAQPGQQAILKKRQVQLQQQLDSLNNAIALIKTNKSQSLSQLAVLEKKIKLREEMVNNLDKEVGALNNDINHSATEVNHLQTNLAKLKQDYSNSIAFTYKNRSSADYINFIFSAASFNDAIKRIQYLKAYRHNREQQAESIVKTEKLLQNKISQLSNVRADKNNVLSAQSSQLLLLEEDRKNKAKVLAGYKKQESNITAQIKRNQKSMADLRNALQQVIKRDEARLASEENKRKMAAKESNTPKNAGTKTKPTEKTTIPVIGSSGKVINKPIPATSADGIGSINFVNHRGSLPWPASSGFVSIHFGPYEVNHIKFFNDGITIALPVGSAVKAVADGEVSAVVDIGGEDAVIVRHGKYYTAYSNLATTSINKGDKVNAGTVIGTAGKNETGEGQLQFNISTSVSGKNTFVDPEVWLHR